MKALVTLALLLTLSGAGARELYEGQWAQIEPEIGKWFRRQMTPDNPQWSCCGEADAYYADKSYTKDGMNFAVITDTRPDGPLGRPHIEVGTVVHVPNHKVMDARKDPNPTGHAIVWIRGSQNSVICYSDLSGI